MTKKTLTLLIPLFNEADNITHFFTEIHPILQKIEKEKKFSLQLKFFDNASTDETFNNLVSYAKSITEYPVEVISWVRNYGVMTSIFGALHYVSTDFVLVLDFDLQDPPDLILNLLEKLDGGFNFVYGVRIFRNENLRMRVLRSIFSVLASILGINSSKPVESGMWLLSKAVIEDLKENPPTTNYIAGVLGTRGFHSASVPYSRRERKHGSSKFSIIKYIGYASEALLSNPYKFMRTALVLGAASISFGLAIELFFLANRYIFHIDIPNGVPLTVLLQIVTSAGVFILLGIIGEYVARVFKTISRPEVPIINRRVKLN